MVVVGVDVLLTPTESIYVYSVERWFDLTHGHAHYTVRVFLEAIGLGLDIAITIVPATLL